MQRFARLMAIPALLCAMAVSGIAAQGQGGGAAQPQQPAPQYNSSPTIRPLPEGFVDGRVLSLDVGVAAGFGLVPNAAIVGKSVGVSFSLAEQFAAGLAAVQAGADNYTLFRLALGLGATAGMDFYIGTDGPLAAGLGAFVRIQKAKTDSGICSSLKLRVDYLFDATAGVTKGDLILALCPSIGI